MLLNRKIVALCCFPLLGNRTRTGIATQHNSCPRNWTIKILKNAIISVIFISIKRIQTRFPPARVNGTNMKSLCSEEEPGFMSANEPWCFKRKRRSKTAMLWKGFAPTLFVLLSVATFIQQHFPLCGQMKGRPAKSRLSRLVSDYEASTLPLQKQGFCAGLVFRTLDSSAYSRCWAN